MNSDIQELFDKYIQKYPEDIRRLTLLKEQLHNKEDLISRKNFRGHVTASGFVLVNNKALLIFHKNLQAFLQPGGHVDMNELLVNAAILEVFEETGVEAVLSDLTDAVPIHIDTHLIPKNDRKIEPEHYHHDFMFVLTAKTEGVFLDNLEVTEYKLVDLDYDFKNYALDKVAGRLRTLDLFQNSSIFAKVLSVL